MGRLSSRSSRALGDADIMTNFVASFDGIKIAYSDSGGAKPALVFVHGWSCNRSFWSSQTDFFAKAYRVIQIDLAGHGSSSLGRSTWTIDAFGRDVCAVIEGADLTDAILIGHSLGGTVAVSAANQMPGQISAVIGIETFRDITERYTAQELEFFEAALKKDLIGEVRRMAAAWFANGTTSAMLEETIINDMSTTDLKAAVPSALAIAGFDYEAELAALVPAFRLINAASDPGLYDPVRQIKDDFDVTFLENVSHFPMMEAPDKFNRALDVVLEGRAAQ